MLVAKISELTKMKDDLDRAIKKNNLHNSEQDKIINELIEFNAESEDILYYSKLRNFERLMVKRENARRWK